MFLINAYAPQIIAEVAKEFDADFITYSSDFVFDGKRKPPIQKKMSQTLYQPMPTAKERER